MSKNIAIKVENLSKQYRLGQVGTGTISHDINRWWHLMRGKEDPYLKIGESNDRTRKGNSEYVWALRDINFEVEKGEVLGIIGKNGAGKSTLLKLLSKVTSPTTGAIKTKGRIASLLEVGTGFHPEMTGRENIYMNGTIMGMSRQEISAKLEEIVEFAGVSRYIDTPVKRYSSGMTVRLGFSIAAHLEPEILIVDEVLAVGDAEFQKKAIGKMQDVSKGEGRTVLFVSHNMASVRALCSRGIILENGEVVFDGNIDEVVDMYLKKEFEGISSTGEYVNKEDVSGEFVLNTIQLLNSKSEVTSMFLSEENITVKINYTLTQMCKNLRINLKVLTANETVVFMTSSHDADETDQLSGKYTATLILPKNFFNKGNYKIAINSGMPNIKVLYPLKTVMEFDIEKLTGSGSRANTIFSGVTAPLLEWHVYKK